MVHALLFCSSAFSNAISEFFLFFLLHLLIHSFIHLFAFHLSVITVYKPSEAIKGSRYLRYLSCLRFCFRIHDLLDTMVIKASPNGSGSFLLYTHGRNISYPGCLQSTLEDTSVQKMSVIGLPPLCSSDMTVHADAALPPWVYGQPVFLWVKCPRSHSGLREPWSQRGQGRRCARCIVETIR